MDQQRIDMFMVTHQKYFPVDKIPYIREQLRYADENKLMLLNMVEYKDPTVMLIVSIFFESALSAKLDIMTVVKDFSEITEAKTKAMVKVLKDLNATGKTLIIADLTAEENKNLVLSARNIPSVKLLLPSNLNVKDLVEADTIIATEAAINSITERLAK